MVGGHCRKLLRSGVPSRAVNRHKPCGHHEDVHAPLGKRGNGRGGYGTHHRSAHQARAVVIVHGRHRENEGTGPGRRPGKDALGREARKVSAPSGTWLLHAHRRASLAAVPRRSARRRSKPRGCRLSRPDGRRQERRRTLLYPTTLRLNRLWSLHLRVRSPIPGWGRPGWMPPSCLGYSGCRSENVTRMS